MLKGTERALAGKIAKAMATTDKPEETEALTVVWTEIFEEIFPHLVANIRVNGMAPSGGGPLTMGVIE